MLTVVSTAAITSTTVKMYRHAARVVKSIGKSDAIEAIARARSAVPIATARCTGTGQAAAAVARDAFRTPQPQSPPQEPSVSPGGEAQHRSARGPTRAPLAQVVVVDQPPDSAQSAASTGA